MPLGHQGWRSDSSKFLQGLEGCREEKDLRWVGLTGRIYGWLFSWLHTTPAASPI